MVAPSHIDRLAGVEHERGVPGRDLARERVERAGSIFVRGINRRRYVEADLRQSVADGARVVARALQRRDVLIEIVADHEGEPAFGLGGRPEEDARGKRRGEDGGEGTHESQHGGPRTKH